MNGYNIILGDIFQIISDISSFIICVALIRGVMTIILSENLGYKFTSSRQGIKISNLQIPFCFVD